MGLTGPRRRKTGKLWSASAPKSPGSHGKRLNPPVLRQETRWERNPALNGVEIQFSDNPPDEVKDLIRLHGFRLARNRVINRIYWWAKATPERMEIAEKAVQMYKNSES